MADEIIHERPKEAGKLQPSHESSPTDEPQITEDPYKMADETSEAERKATGSTNGEQSESVQVVYAVVDKKNETNRPGETDDAQAPVDNSFNEEQLQKPEDADENDIDEPQEAEKFQVDSTEEQSQITEDTDNVADETGEAEPKESDANLNKEQSKGGEEVYSVVNKKNQK